LIWEYRAYAQFDNLRTNRYGFRDYDFETENKDAGTYRIAFIGDSVTLGFGVNFDETFVRNFEVEAKKRIGLQKVKALGFGVDGYNAIQICEMLKVKVMSFSPDKVVYVMCLNDFDFEDASAGKIRYFRKPKSFILMRIRQVYKRLSGITYQESKYHDYHFQKNKKIVFQKILEMRGLLKEQQIPFYVGIVPVLHENMDSFDDYTLQDIHNEISSVLLKHNIPVLDLLPVFQNKGKSSEYFFIDVWHPNARGHEIIAKSLLQLVL